jgi:hypothetical protein
MQLPWPNMAYTSLVTLLGLINQPVLALLRLHICKTRRTKLEVSFTPVSLCSEKSEATRGDAPGKASWLQPVSAAAWCRI